MASKALVAFSLVLAVSLAGISCGKTHAQPSLDSDALMQIVRSYSANKPTAQAQPVARPAEAPQASAAKLETEEEYEAPIKQAFSQGNFDQLEKTIKEARESKGRILGGVWKVDIFYTAIYQTFLGPQPQEAEWKMHFDSLNQWIKAKPQSAAARISFAEAYTGYAWVARGDGAANTVSDEGWELFQERNGLAVAALVEAAQLKEKCPYWYEAMQMVALDQGWDKSQARELLEEAVRFEPDYYHFYRQHAHYLEPRWYGDEGELEAFATEVADRVGGPKGDILYFEIASLHSCQCNSEAHALDNMSWLRIKDGYSALAQTYGVSTLKRNRFASMAVKVKDREAAREAFAGIGPDWDKDVWVSDQKFANAKNWALSE